MRFTSISGRARGPAAPIAPRSCSRAPWLSTLKLTTVVVFSSLQGFACSTPCKLTSDCEQGSYCNAERFCVRDCVADVDCPSGCTCSTEGTCLNATNQQRCSGQVSGTEARSGHALNDKTQATSRGSR